MNLTKYGKYKLQNKMANYEVDRDFADPIYNYLVHGFNPGSFFTSVLANDFMDAIARSHPANTIKALKKLVCFIVNEMPHGITHGSYEVVDAWTKLSTEERRKILEECKLILTEQEEIMKVLKDEPVTEPFFW
jgi:predicted Fe-S protein YdhL (DUF1289 family)